MGKKKKKNSEKVLEKNSVYIEVYSDSVRSLDLYLLHNHLSQYTLRLSLLHVPLLCMSCERHCSPRPSCFVTFGRRPYFLRNAWVFRYFHMLLSNFQSHSEK